MVARTGVGRRLGRPRVERPAGPLVPIRKRIAPASSLRWIHDSHCLPAADRSPGEQAKLQDHRPQGAVRLAEHDRVADDGPPDPHRLDRLRRWLPLCTAPGQESWPKDPVLRDRVVARARRICRCPTPVSQRPGLRPSGLASPRPPPPGRIRPALADQPLSLAVPAGGEEPLAEIFAPARLTIASAPSARAPHPSAVRPSHRSARTPLASPLAAVARGSAQ